MRVSVRLRLHHVRRVFLELPDHFLLFQSPGYLGGGALFGGGFRENQDSRPVRSLDFDQFARAKDGGSRACACALQGVHLARCNGWMDHGRVV